MAAVMATRRVPEHGLGQIGIREALNAGVLVVANIGTAVALFPGPQTA